MKTNNKSVTGEALTIVIVFNGMVSLSRTGKSVNPNAKNGTDFKRTKQTVVDYFSPTGRRVKGNVPNEDLDITMKTTQCVQICRISANCIAHWQKEGKNVKSQLDDLAYDYARAASSGSRILPYTWYVQTPKELSKQPVIKQQEVIELRKPITKVVQEIEWISHKDRPSDETLDQVNFAGVVLNVVGYVDLSKFKKNKRTIT